MNDLGTVVWKEIAEFIGNRRFLRIFAISVLAMGVLPALSAHAHAGQGPAASQLLVLIRLIFVLFATAIVGAQTAPDLVLHERLNRTMDYLLATRLPDSAIFGGKVLVSAAVAYASAIVALALQLLTLAITQGHGLRWLYLSLPEGRILAFGATAALSLYVAVVGTFVALRVGDQRAAYMVTIFAVGLLTTPFLLGLLQVSLTVAWLSHATEIFSLFALCLGLVGLRLFRREMLVLYLQE